MAHSKLPFKAVKDVEPVIYSDDYDIVAVVKTDQDANFITKACNEHDGLVGVLQKAQTALIAYNPSDDCFPEIARQYEKLMTEIGDVLERCKEIK